MLTTCIAGDWNGAGLHSNFSTKGTTHGHVSQDQRLTFNLEMRKQGGMKHIEDAIKKLELRHDEHIAVYGVSGMACCGQSATTSGAVADTMTGGQ